MRGKGYKKSFRTVWYLENHRNLVETYPNLLTKNVKRGANILENTSKITKVIMKSVCTGKWITPFSHIIKI